MCTIWTLFTATQSSAQLEADFLTLPILGLAGPVRILLCLGRGPRGALRRHDIAISSMQSHPLPREIFQYRQTWLTDTGNACCDMLGQASRFLELPILAGPKLV